MNKLHVLITFYYVGVPLIFLLGKIQEVIISQRVTEVTSGKLDP